MSTVLAGSAWRKWDLHVHTPESFYHRYPGTHDEAWEAFLTDLEALPEEFKVIGINDYILVDGYEKVLKEKRERGRLTNIDLILPVIELRLDKFGGTVQPGKTGSSWSRVNLHVIFDQVEAQLIREQFIAAISPNYRLLPGSLGKGSWHQVMTRKSIEALGDAILSTVPKDKLCEFGSPLMEGFNNLNVTLESVLKALDNDALNGKSIIAIGKSEWENLKWNDHTIAEKKTLINTARLVFTAAASPSQYEKGRAKLRESGVNDRLLDCSDAHYLSSSTDKDRIGNCFTWIKSDCTFNGLLQAIEEFDGRVYVGYNPPKRALVEANKTKFIRSIEIVKKRDSTLKEKWFDLHLPLNNDLVAVIGNKGSGKSALSDIVALAGYTRNFSKFSFLTPNRFRSAKGRFASQFTATLTWRDGTTSTTDLDRDPDASAVERVKCLPQSYLEDLCNELGARGSESFDAELRKIIYSHVPEEERLGRASMDDLLAFKVTEIGESRQTWKQVVSKTNIEILDAERRNGPEFKKSLEEQLVTKKAELAALDAFQPKAVADPSTSPDAMEESKAAANEIERLRARLQQIESEADAQRNTKSIHVRTQAVAIKIRQALANFSKEHETFVGNLSALIRDLGAELSIDSMLRVEVDTRPVDALVTQIQKQIAEIDKWLRDDAPGGFMERRTAAAAALEVAKSKLGERQREFVRYKEELVDWERRKVAVKGAKDKPGSILWLEAEIASLAALPAKLEDLKARRVQAMEAIHGQIHAMVDEYKRLYGPVQAFVTSAQQMEMQIPLEFHVRIEEVGFEEQFLNRLNRQVRGSFSGIEESTQRLHDMLAEVDFDSKEGAVGFASRIDNMLHMDVRDGQARRETRLSEQLRRGTDPLELLDYLFGLDYLVPRYSLTYAQQEIGQLSPGERGLLLLVFYLLVDKNDIPIIIDQPEENLDNQTIYKVLVKCIKRAKDRRQVIVVTHNPNLAVVCDAEQIVYASCNKVESSFEYEAGAIECPEIRGRVVQILEGTEPAFKNRQSKYRLR